MCVVVFKQVIEKGEGELVVARRPSAKNRSKYSSENFLPCEFCLGFYLKEHLWHHVSKCLLKPLGKAASANFCRNAKVLLSPFLKPLSEEEASLETFFNGMKETRANPGIVGICKNDPLIAEFAKSMLQRLGEVGEQRIKDTDNARTKVRTVGRLLKKLNDKNDLSTPSPLSTFISGKQFARVVDATKALALECDSPQLALTLGHYVKHIGLLKVNLGIQEDNEECVKEARNFSELYQAHWNNRVSSVAKRRQKLRHLNKPSKIPFFRSIKN